MKITHASFIAAICIFLLDSCRSSTEERIRSAIEKNERYNAEKNGEKIESLIIDSITYKVIPKNYYYILLQNRLSDEELKSGIDDMKKFNLYSESGKQYIAEKHDLESKEFERKKILLDSIINKTDPSLSAYRVNYHLILKTTQNSIDNHMESFFNEKDLSILDFK